MNACRKLPLAMLSLIVLTFAPIGEASAQVKVTAADPASTIQGTVSLDITVSGSGFDGTAKAKFLVAGTTDTGGITVRKTVVKGSKQLVATIDVADAAAVSKFDIEVTLDSGRKGKGTTLFAVQAKVAAIDPCLGANARGFPSFVFTRQTTTNGGSTWGILVADAEGKCERLVGSVATSRDVNLRYDAATATGLLVYSAGGYELVAATLTVSFNADGSPVVQASAFQTLVAVADLPDPQMVDWGPLVYIGGPVVSQDGTAILFRGSDTAPGNADAVFWTCPLNSSTAIVDASTCGVVHRGPSEISATWGARAGIIYVVQPAVSGSGSSLYRLTLPTPASPTSTFEEIWSRGTLLTFAKATLASGVEEVAVYEPNIATLCGKAWVIDADSCSGNACNVLNGQGHPARGFLTWLPDGRVAAEGQKAPDRRGKCSAAGTVVSFEATDLTGTTTTVTQGVYPDGAGGG